MKKILSLVLTLFISGFVYAVPPQGEQDMPQQPKEHQQKMKQNFEKFIKEYNITEEQGEKVKQRMQSDIEKKKQLRKQLKEKFKAIDAELLKENFDINIINGLSEEIQKINAEISKIDIEGKIEMRNILSFEQFSKMEQKRKEDMKKFKNEKKRKNNLQ